MSSDLPQQSRLEPRLPAALASLIFTAAALLLCAPIFAGRFLVGPSSDQYGAGYAFREFGARLLRETGAVPEWNPFLFGGMPFIAAMHGDIYYPTALLRRIMPTDAAMNVGFFLHFIIAGAAMYALLRYLRSTWTGAVVGGLAYELSGILASMVKPGHDGKLFVSALAPLAFLALLVAVRDGKRWGYALLAAVTGLCLVSPHYQMTYYVLVTSGLFALWLAFLDPERRPTMVPVRSLAAAALAVGLGVACSAVQALPFLDYIPFSPRGAGGPSAGWEYATSFSLPIEELATTLLPQFNGVLEQYWGQNFFKLHTEYVGALVIPLAVIGMTDRERGPIRWGFMAVLVLALLIAFGSHTPFYRAWYEIMPMMKKVRAPGMAFFLVAMPLALFAGFGTDRLMRRFAVTPVFAGIAFGVPAIFGLLGAVGALQPLAEALAPAELMERAIANADALRAGGTRLFVMALLGTIAAVLIAGRRLKGVAAAAALMSLVTLDLWSVDRQFFTFSPPAAELYAKDAITERLASTPLPYRVLDPFPGTVYEHSILMGLGIPQVFGYHGNQVRFYDEVWGGKNIYANLPRLHLWDLWAVRFLLLPEAQAVPGYRQILGPVTTAQGRTGFLFERDSLPAYARVVAAAVKVSDDQAAATVADARFPVSDIVIVPDTVSGDLPVVQGNAAMPPLTPVTARVAAWAPGSMRVELNGADARPTYLVVSETWYPGWTATIDGAPARVIRGNAAMITVPVPAGAKAVELRFHLAASDRGRMISLAAVAVVLLLAGTSSLGGGRPRPDRVKPMPASASERRAA